MTETYIQVDKREDGTTSSMRGVDGYYLQQDGSRARQTRVYDVKTDAEALVRARADGLSGISMVEVFLGELQPCVLKNVGITRGNK